LAVPRNNSSVDVDVAVYRLENWHH